MFELADAEATARLGAAIAPLLAAGGWSISISVAPAGVVSRS